MLTGEYPTSAAPSAASLDGESWVVSLAAETPGAVITATGTVGEALARAARATSAAVVLGHHGTLPGGGSAAVIHR